MENSKHGTNMVAIIAVLLSLFISIISWLVPIGLWITAIAAGVKVRIFDLGAMRLRRVPPAGIVEPQNNATKAGLSLSLDDLEAHFLAGGRVRSVVSALIAADKANISLGFAQAAQLTSQDAMSCKLSKSALRLRLLTSPIEMTPTVASLPLPAMVSS